MADNDLSLLQLLDDITPKHKIELHKVISNPYHTAFKKIEEAKIYGKGEVFKFTDKGRERFEKLSSLDESEIKFGGDTFIEIYYKDKEFNSIYNRVSYNTRNTVIFICLQIKKNNISLTEFNRLDRIPEWCKDGIENLVNKEMIEIL